MHPLLRNSYVILIITFIAVSVICYIFGWGYSTEVNDGKVVKKWSWKYPLAIALIVWVIWHFYIYPPQEIKTPTTTNETYDNAAIASVPLVAQTAGATNNFPRINMNNWN